MSSTLDTSSIESEGNKATEQLMFGLNSTLIAISTITLCLRLYTRGVIVRAMGADDAMAVLAWTFAVFQSSMDMYFVPLGSGVHIQYVSRENLSKFLNLIPIMLMFYFWAMFFVRLTCILFLPRLSQDTLYLRLVWTVAAIAAINTLVCFFLVLSECSPISDLWNVAKVDRNCKYPGYQGRIVWANSGVGLFVDLCIMALPIWMIMTNLRFSRVKAMQVCLIFCVGFFSIVCGAIRLGLIVTIGLEVDTTFKFPRVAAWTESEIHLGFWCACFPAIKALLRLASFKMGLRSSPDTTGRGHDATHSKYRVPSRPSSAHAFQESLVRGKSFGGTRDKETWGSKAHAPDEIELVERGPER